MFHFRLFFWFAMACILLLGPLNAIGQNLSFNHIKAENGLLNNSVMAITQDAHGFIWFGTRRGICRYDGIHFKNYPLNNEAKKINSSINNIVCLRNDKSGNLWIGSQAGLLKYNMEKDSFSVIALNGKLVQNITSVYQDSRKNIWIASINGLFIAMDDKKEIFKPFNPSNCNLKSSNIRALFEDKKGNLWAGTDNGLTKIQYKNGKYHFETLQQSNNNPNGLHANFITCIAEDVDNNLWIGSQNDGISQFDPNSGSFTHFSHSNTNKNTIINNSIRKIICTSNGNIWVGTQEGLSIINPANGQITSYKEDATQKNSLSQNSIYSLFEDSNKSVWVGTYFGGANVTYASNTDFTNIQNTENPQSLSNNVVSSIVEDEKHNLWIATEGGGINYHNLATGQFTIYKHNPADATSLGSNLVKFLHLDKNQTLWIGTHGGGLNLLEKNKTKFKRLLYMANDPATLNSEIITIFEDSFGRLWVSTNRGLKLYRKINTGLEPLDKGLILSQYRNIIPQAFFEDRKKNIWIGTEHGLFKLSGSETVRIDSTHYINCITQDAKGTIWAGINFGGIAAYDEKNATLIPYTKKNELNNTNVLSILNDSSGNLWLSTNEGLKKFNPSNNSIHTYTASDGLAGNEFNYNSYLKHSNGKLYFGGFNGITSFYPDKIEENKQEAPIVFTGLKLFNRNVEINGKTGVLNAGLNYAETLKFKHNQNVITIEFAILNFIKSNKNKYAYKLDGFDNGWNEVSNPAATYTNLSPGSYTFWVKGANNDGVWSQPKALQILIKPPFWRTWWAYLIYIAAIAGITYLIVKYLFLQELLKKEEELHQLKLNFFTNISHEIRTHLSLIMAPIDQMLYKNEYGFNKLNQVKNNTERLSKLVSEIMDFRKAETNYLTLKIALHNIVPFLQDICYNFEQLAATKKIKFTFVSNKENIPVYFDQEQLEKVFFNLLSNAFKFTPEGGHIEMTIKSADTQLQIDVKDNGRGIAQEYLNKLFSNFFQVVDHGVQNTGYGIGLALSKHIVELHKGSITVQSSPATDNGQGHTQFTVTMLSGNEHFKGTGFAILPTAEIAKNGQPKTIPTIEHTETEPLTRQLNHDAYTVLIVDDNEELRELIQQTLNPEYKVITTDNGLAAWQIATEQLPDIVISDVMMPEMDGHTLCKKLKTDQRTSHIPIILLTAKSKISDQISGLETGADVYITKPFSTKALELNVRNLLTLRENLRQQLSSKIAAQPLFQEAIAISSQGIVNNTDKEFLENVLQIIDTNISEQGFGVEALSKKVAMSIPVLYKKIRAVSNMSVNELIKSIRLNKAALLLRQKNKAVYEVAYEVGFEDWRYFGKEFKKKFGKTPSEYGDEGCVNGKS